MRREMIGLQCEKCFHWYSTMADVRTAFDTLTMTERKWDRRTSKFVEVGELTAKHPRVIVSHWGEHNCKTESKKGKYDYD